MDEAKSGGTTNILVVGDDGDGCDLAREQVLRSLLLSRRKNILPNLGSEMHSKGTANGELRLATGGQRQLRAGHGGCRVPSDVPGVCPR